MKTEKKPKFIKGELTGLYDATDLEYALVFGSVKTLGAYKMIDIPDSTVRLWYVEMLKIKWTKQQFLEKVEALKRADVFNRIDWSDWIRTEMVYTKADVKVMLSDQLNRMIQKGQRLLELMERGYTLTEEEKSACRLAASKSIEFEFSRQRAETIQEYEQSRRSVIRERVAGKRLTIMRLSEKERFALINELTHAGILTDCKTEQELNTQVKFLEYFANIIPAEILSKYEPELNKQTKE